MYIILGATGHIGSELVKQLVENGKEVLGITSDKKHVAQIEKAGAKAAIANIRDVEQLIKIFQKGSRLYLLNPPAPPVTDTSREEYQNVQSILQAVKHATFEKIVVESTYGAQPGNQLGDLDVLCHLENQAAALQPNTTIIRGAYYFSNWDFSLETAAKEGKIYSLYPVHFELPMVAPVDIAILAAKLLQSNSTGHQLFYIEGPRPYSTKDVAAAFSQALQKEVHAVEIKRDKWLEYFLQLQFSRSAAESMINMTEITLEKKYDFPNFPERGTTSLEKYIQTLVAAKNGIASQAR